MADYHNRTTPFLSVHAVLYLKQVTIGTCSPKHVAKAQQLNKNFTNNGRICGAPYFDTEFCGKFV